MGGLAIVLAVAVLVGVIAIKSGNRPTAPAGAVAEDRAQVRSEEEEIVAKHILRDRQVQFLRWGPHLLEKDMVKLLDDLTNDLLDAETRAKIEGQPFWELQKREWRDNIQGLGVRIRVVYRDRWGNRDKLFNVSNRAVRTEVENQDGDNWIEARVQPFRDSLKQLRQMNRRW